MSPTQPDEEPDRSPDGLVTALAAAVVEYRVRRVPLRALRVAFAQYDPTGAASSSARARLRAAIEELAADGRIVLPRQKKSYEAHVAPALPTWVERSVAPRAAPAEIPKRVWRPELAAAAALCPFTGAVLQPHFVRGWDGGLAWR